MLTSVALLAERVVVIQSLNFVSPKSYSSLIMNRFNNSAPLSDESKAYLLTRPKSERSLIGQFLTPRILRDALIAQIPLTEGMRVLDPGVGTGEFLRSCSEKAAELALFGWDIDESVLDVARRLVPEANLTRRSALSDWDGEKFDVVIGNPPYFEMRKMAPELRKDFGEVISGRPNIFSLFFKVASEVLREGGYLAYVVPPSMNNGAYFEKLRQFIIGNFSIEYLEVFTNLFLFEDVQTAVQLIVLRKGQSSTKHLVDLASLSGSPRQRTIFSAEPSLFKAAFENRTSLFQLGYKASTGTVVWNTRKADLRQTASKDTVPLIWASNIGDQPEVFLVDDHPKRKQYIRNVEPMTGPAIVVNRITGSVGRGSLRCALIPSGMEFVAENHVNVIQERPGVATLTTWTELLNKLRRPEVTKHVQMLTGNTQISATELTNWIPLDQ